MSDFLNNFPTNPKKVYSQTGEEGILEYIFANVGTTNKYLVDFGAGDGFSLSNSQLLLENGWKGLRMDGKGTNDVKAEFITVGNILELFYKYDVPKQFDLLSIDIDGNDYWVLAEILKVFKPLVIVAEINGCLEPYESIAMKYNPTHVHEGNDYYGASFEAFKRLCSDYVIVHNRLNLNIFLVHKDLIGEVESTVTCIKDQYHPHSPNREWVVNPEMELTAMVRNTAGGGNYTTEVTNIEDLTGNNATGFVSKVVTVAPQLTTPKKRGRPSKK